MVCPPFASGSFIEEYGVVSGHDDKQLRVILGIYVNLFSLYLSYYSVYVSTISFSINFGTSRNHVCDCSFITCQNFIFGKYVRLTVCYLPKFHFWQVCSFNGLFVCLCVRSERDNSRTLWDIFTKPHHQLLPWPEMMCIVFLEGRSNVELTRSQKPQNFQIAITRLIFKLEHRNKNWNVA